MADQRRDFAGLDFNEVLKKNEDLAIKPISERTVAKYVSEVSAVFKWLSKEGFVETNVFDGLHVNLPRDRSERKPFLDNQMVTLFTSPLFMGSAGTRGRHILQPGRHKTNDWRFWLPILAAFTGARQPSPPKTTKTKLPDASASGVSNA